MPSSDGPPFRAVLFTRAWRSSGAGLFAQELAASLADAGVSLRFIAPRAQDERFERPRPNLSRRRPPHEAPGRHRIANAVLSVARICLGAFYLLAARLMHRVFIVSIPDPLPFALPVLALLHFTGARIIFIAHDPLPHAWRLPAGLRGLEKAAHGACYRLAAQIVVLSEPTERRMVDAFPFSRGRTTVIEHGVFALNDMPPIPGSGMLCCFGTLRRNKGIVESMQGAIAAHAEGAPVRLIVAGAPSRDEKDYAEEIVRLAATAPGIIDLRMGYVDDAALRDLLCRSDALLLPYQDFHSQSGVALLAASNARPIIAAPVGGIGALMAEGMPCAAITPPVSGGSVAAAIAAFMSRPVDQWRAEAEAYRDVTMERRSWPAVARGYASLVRALTRSP